MNENEKLAFFSRKANPPLRVNMGGKKVAFANFPEALKKKVLEKLAAKDDVIAQGHKGILPGIKIDGKQVTKDNIHEFEIAKMPDKPKVKVEKKYTKEELQKLSFGQLKKLAEKFGETGRSRTGLIKDILKHL